MSRYRITHTLVWLAVIGATLYLIERLAVVTELLAGPILMFACAWLIALIIEPLFVVLHRFRIPRLWAGMLVYAVLVSFMVVFVLALIPVVYTQIDSVSRNVPAGMALLWDSLMSLQTQLKRFGIQSDISTFFQADALANQFGSLGTSAVQQSLGLAGGIAQLLFDVFIVLILSFYMAIDGQTLFRKVVSLCPMTWRDEVEIFGRIMTQTFGGFMRTQLLSSFVYSFVNALVMMMLDVPSITLVTVIVAVLLMIPVVGGMIALIPPVLIIALNQPQQILLYVIIMVCVQQILFNVILPRIMGKAVGLHPLLVFGALLIGSAVAGPWGVLFGIPLAGVAAAVANYGYMRMHPPVSETP